MWFLNKKSIIIDLPKLTYRCWEEVKWIMKFDFGEEKVKTDKINIWLNRTISSNWIKTGSSVGVSSEKHFTFLHKTTLMWEWEYSKEEIPFNFIIPTNAIPDEISFDKILNKIPKSLRSMAEMLLDMFMPNMRKKYSFYIVARIDIPWAIDITEKININITNN